MNGLDAAALDRHITGGDYRIIPADFSCRACDWSWVGWVEQEYGAESWAPHENCPKCGSGEVDWFDAEPPQRYDTAAERDADGQQPYYGEEE